MKLVMEMLRVRASGVRLSAGVNGLPLVIDETGGGVATRVPLNLWLHPEGNRLTVDVSPVPTTGPHALPSPKEAPYFSVELMTAQEGAPPLAKVGWTYPKDRPFLAQRLELPVSVATPVPTRLWHEAARLGKLTDDDRRQAVQAGARVHEAFAARRLDDVINLLSWRFEEFARAFGEDVAEMKAGARQAYGRLVDDPTWKPEAIVEKDVQARLLGDGQLVLLERRGQPWIASAQGSSQLVTLPVFVARLSGEWVVVR